MARNFVSSGGTPIDLENPRDSTVVSRYIEGGACGNASGDAASSIFASYDLTCSKETFLFTSRHLGVIANLFKSDRAGFI